MNKKPLWISTLAADVVVTLIYVGVINNAPEFIRSIKGEDFIGIWLGYSLVVSIIGALIVTIVVSSFCKAKSKEANAKIYSDGDLMLIQGFDRYKRVGYYLLKAKLHNVIKYTETAPNGEVNGTIAVDINRNIPESELNKYCEQNPNVGKIVEYIKARKSSSDELDIKVDDIVFNIVTNATTQSDGGKFINACQEKLKKIF